MIKEILESAEAVGISAFFLNSSERIEAQLNKYTRDEMNPIMLISWDIDTNLNFDANGFLENPSSNIVSLLVQKAESTSDEDAILATDEMETLFQKFIQDLYNRLNPLMRVGVAPITGASYKRAPRHGAGKHSGVLGKWTQRNPITINCNG